jgi:hypothetical protein
MEPKTQKKVQSVLDEALILAKSGMNEFDAARQAVAKQRPEVYRELAIAAIVDSIRRHVRAETLAIERKSVDRSKFKFEPTPEFLEREAERSRQFWQHMNQITEQFAAELKAEWTAELLSSEFALADGTTVTWGDATVEQHEQRVELFTRNAVANAEGAARHKLAIEALKQSGSPTLNDLAKVAA